MSEEYLIRHCAPTLAGLKTASMFTVPYDTRENLRQHVRNLNRRLRSKGLRLLPLRFSDQRALLYLYRPVKLAQDLSCADAASLLVRCGYRLNGCSGCIVQLARRLRAEGNFPHEVGLFLGYPVEDVHGFMENRTCKFTGCWKVYGDEDSARKTFDQYKKCTRVYQTCWQNGSNIDRLTVAG